MKLKHLLVLAGVFAIGYAVGSNSKQAEDLTKLSFRELNDRLNDLVKNDTIESYRKAAIIRDAIKLKKTKLANS